MELIENRYNIDFKGGLLGEGASKKVYKGYDTYLDKNIILLIEKGYEIENSNNLIEIARRSSNLDNPNLLKYDKIVKIKFDDETFEGVIIDYAEVGTLNDLKNYELTDAIIIDVFKGILSGLIYLHENGIIHRDLKPENILIFKNSNGDFIPKIADFGISYFKDSERKGAIVGTPAFMDPDYIFTGISKKQNDIWSLGAIIYNFFTGKYPIGSGLNEFLKNISQGIVIDFEKIPVPFDEILKLTLIVKAENRPTANDLMFILLKRSIEFSYNKILPKEKSRQALDNHTMMISRSGLPDLNNEESINKWVEAYSREKIKVLFLAANPTMSPLSLDKEISRIANSIKLSKNRDKFVLHSAHAVSPDSLIQEILDFEPNIIHFSGHGTTLGIVLESNNGSEQIVSEKSLLRLFGLFNNIVDCVILNSCFSINQANAINSKIDYVVGMNNSIPDTTAISFSAGFYKGLGNGKGIEFSFELGLANIELEGYDGVEIPQLLKRHDA